MKPKIWTFVLTLFALFAGIGLGGRLLAQAEPEAAQESAAALTTAFTYQGQLQDGGSPADGVYDLQFTLYDALSGGAQVGSSVTLNDVTVSGGIFTVELDFGGSAFTGDARWLEIGVRPGSDTGAYTTLAPRQPLTAAPYALYAAGAPWSGLSGVPAGFADGTDNNTTYTAGDGLELVSGTQFQGKGTPYQNVVIVAKSGGDFTTVTDALNSIQDAGANNPYLIYVAPGTYTETVTMKSYVDIEGSGELTTRITYTGNSSINAGTVEGADNAELRFLTVENTGGDNYAVAIYNNASPRLTRVTASASGGTTSSHGVRNNNNASPTMTSVTASASGGSFSYGVTNNNSSSPTMTNVTASASGGTSNYGVHNYAYSSPMMTNVTASASGGAYNYGVYNYFYSSPTMMNVTASVSGGAGAENYGVLNFSNASTTMMNVTANASGGTSSYGVSNEYSSPTMTSVAASASGALYNYGVQNKSSGTTMTNVTASASGGTDNYGVYNSSASPTINNSVIRASDGVASGIYNYTSDLIAYTVRVNNSQISGDDYAIYNDPQFVMHIGASQLSGPVLVNGGLVRCVSVYDENYLSPGYSTCPS